MPNRYHASKYIKRSATRSGLICDKSASAGIVVIICLLTLFLACSDHNKSLTVFSRLLVEYSENPSGIDKSHPRFSWIITSAERHQIQTAFRILVSSSREGLLRNSPDMWDSGLIESDETIQHEYLPDNLKSDSHYFWMVLVHDGEGRVIKSNISEFSTAFLPGTSWTASWIGRETEADIPPAGFYKNITEQPGGRDTVFHDGRSLLLRYEAEVKKNVVSATAFITGVGYYELYVNGSRVGDNVLSPAKTPYHKYILYDTYDLTPLLKEGMNAFGIHLGNGWYNPYKKWWNEYRMQWFGPKKAIAEIHVKYSDGSTGIIASNENWLCSPGPVVYNCVYDGEVYDGNLEQPGWTEAGFDDSSWKKVAAYGDFSPRLVSQRMPAIKVHETFSPREIGKGNGKRHIYDMGQNFAGWVKIRVKGNPKDIIKIRFAEDIKVDSTLDFTSNENAKATAEYILKGGQTETYEPGFSFFGFRYAEISAVSGSPEIIEVQGRAVYSGNRFTGKFECANDLVNRIHKATVWSQKSNMIGYPMDCPQRDERLGWMGDAQVTAEEAMCNFDMALFYENWLNGILENQDDRTGDIPIISPRPYIRDEGVEWSSTYILLAWQYYLQYGDRELLARHYRSMKGYLHFLGARAVDKILPKGWIGDWGSMAEGWKEGDPGSVPTAYYFLDSEIMSDIAGILNIPDDRDGFRKLSEVIREKYNNKFLDTLSCNYDDGSQMANSFPIYLGLVPAKYRTGIIDHLVKDIEVRHKDHLTTGVLGTKYLPEVLESIGRPDIAWRLINQRTAPSWYDMMSKYNTMCEFWTLKQSKNHVMMGSIDAWFYRHLAGIQPDNTGVAFSSFKIKPVIPDSLEWAKGSIETLRGIITSEWHRKNGILTLSVEVPFNTKAEVYIPGKENEDVKESGKSLKSLKNIEYVGYMNNCNVVTVGSGKYIFKTGL